MSARVTLVGFEGDSCGVTFRDGVAEDVPEGPALRYFRRSGRYRVDEDPEPVGEDGPRKAAGEPGAPEVRPDAEHPDAGLPLDGDEDDDEDEDGDPAPEPSRTRKRRP